MQQMGTEFMVSARGCDLIPPLLGATGMSTFFLRTFTYMYHMHHAKNTEGPTKRGVVDLYGKDTHTTTRGQPSTDTQPTTHTN
jgi:hypothetical protein